MTSALVRAPGSRTAHPARARGRLAAACSSSPACSTYLAPRVLTGADTMWMVALGDEVAVDGSGADRRALRGCRHEQLAQRARPRRADDVCRPRPRPRRAGPGALHRRRHHAAPAGAGRPTPGRPPGRDRRGRRPRRGRHAAGPRRRPRPAALTRAVRPARAAPARRGACPVAPDLARRAAARGLGQPARRGARRRRPDGLLPAAVTPAPPAAHGRAGRARGVVRGVAQPGARCAPAPTTSASCPTRRLGAAPRCGPGPTSAHPSTCSWSSRRVVLGGLALRWARMRPWEVVATLGMAVATATSARHGMWLLMFLIGPAAVGLTVRSGPRGERARPVDVTPVSPEPDADGAAAHPSPATAARASRASSSPR